MFHEVRHRVVLASAAVAAFLTAVLPFPGEARAAEDSPVFHRARIATSALAAGQRLKGAATASAADGSDAGITWDFGDGTPAATGGAVSHAYTAPGLFTVTIAADGGAAPDTTQTFRVVVLPRAGTPKPTATPSSRKVIPFEYVRLAGAFRTDAPTHVEFRFGKTGLIVPATQVTADSVRVAAPPLPKGATFTGGTASVHVIQGEGAAATFTSAGKIAVSKLKRSTLPPGEMTRSFLQLARGVLTDAQAKVAGSQFDTPENAEAITSCLAFLDAMATNVGARSFAGAGLSASVESDFEIALSASAVRQMDSFFGGVVEAGTRNTTDPGLRLAFESWNDAVSIPRTGQLSAAQLAAIVAAEQEYRDRVRTETAALTDGLNAALGPTTTAISALGLAGIATGDPATLLVAGQLALCSDVMLAGLVLGLSLDSAYAALTDDDVGRAVYLATANNLTAEFATGKALGAVVRLAGGAKIEELFGALRDTANGFGAEILTFQSLTQPRVPADATLSVGDASVFEGDSGTRDLVFSVRLSVPSARSVRVKCSTTGGTASPGVDYERIRGATLTFAPGETVRTIAVRIRGDRLKEPTETFLLSLASATGAPIAQGTATGTIANDDISSLRAETGSGATLGTATGCGYSATLSIDGTVHHEVAVDGDGPANARVWAYVYTQEYGSLYYEWEGTLAWNGDVLSGTLTRTDNPARPSATVTIVRDPGGNYELTASAPFTYRLFELDGSCTGPLQTFTHAVTGISMTAE